MSAHTPGKWFVDPNKSGDIQAEGTEIATAFCEQNIGRKWVIQGPITVDTETCKANARLIAKAPDMHDLLSELADYLDVPESAAGGDDTARAYCKRIRELLA